jgi:hypothetical protein
MGTLRQKYAKKSKTFRVQTGCFIFRAKKPLFPIQHLVTISAELERYADRRRIMDAGEKKALSDIEEFGCHIIHVLEDEEGPPFVYSVSVQKSSGAPEAMVIGLKQPIAHFVVNEYNRRVRSGERFSPGARYDG